MDGLGVLCLLVGECTASGRQCAALVNDFTSSEDILRTVSVLRSAMPWLTQLPAHGFRRESTIVMRRSANALQAPSFLRHEGILDGKTRQPACVDLFA